MGLPAVVLDVMLKSLTVGLQVATVLLAVVRAVGKGIGLPLRQREVVVHPFMVSSCENHVRVNSTSILREA